MHVNVALIMINPTLSLITVSLMQLDNAIGGISGKLMYVHLLMHWVSFY